MTMTMVPTHTDPIVRLIVGSVAHKDRQDHRRWSVIVVVVVVSVGSYKGSAPSRDQAGSHDSFYDSEDNGGELEISKGSGSDQSSLSHRCQTRTASSREDHVFEGTGLTRVHSLINPRQNQDP